MYDFPLPNVRGKKVGGKRTETTGGPCIAIGLTHTPKHTHQQLQATSSYTHTRRALTLHLSE